MTPVDEVSGLEEERRFLLESLRDLERERQSGDLSEDDYIELRDQYTARAATVLRALRASGTPVEREITGENRHRRPAPPTEGRGGSGAPARRPTPRRTVATLVALLLLVVLAAVTVANTAGPRGDGQPATGSIDSPAPGNRMAQALALEREGRATDALKLYDAILRDDPDNVAALSYRGWLLHRAGLTDRALESLDRAVAADPSFPDAHFFRGMVLYQGRKDPAAAVPEFRAFLANRPPQEMVPAVEDVLDRALAEVARGAQAPPVPATPPPPPTSP